MSLSTSLVEAWCTAVKEKQHVGALKNLLRAFRTACHYGDGEMEDVGSKFNITNSHVFNKIMLFVLVDIDAVFKKMLGLADMNEKKSGSVEVQKLSKWKKLEPFVKTYLGNALHILNQMTDNQMIAFTVRRLKASVIFLAAFPILARKYMKVQTICSNSRISIWFGLLKSSNIFHSFSCHSCLLSPLWLV